MLIPVVLKLYELYTVGRRLNKVKEGDMGGYGIAVLSFFSCGISVILILMCGIAVSSRSAVCGFPAFG